MLSLHLSVHYNICGIIKTKEVSHRSRLEFRNSELGYIQYTVIKIFVGLNFHGNTFKVHWP